ncbi:MULTISPECIES: hypothetical protein [Chromatiaceae]|jgi:hypothetical protein|uniref:Transmembrane anchor protein n=1 Tax=Arsukibacterium indicum TaxID=2848612 RepID=A0ABS6MPJ6_9GAMM|nr:MULTISPECIES: hypothetical protein [Chromatiaceae]MBV2130309.1 hypothetical protein [Arsukibacterium indicum]MCD1596771.1 hypothetical protein [Rheinheimera aquimaris]
MQHTVSTKTLIKAGFAAIGVAIVALVTFILPAEYNVDPTGIGQALGLTSIAQASQSNGSATTAAGTGSDAFETITILVPAGKGVEYKFAMTKQSKMTYEWMTDGGELFYDLHGEPEGDTTGYFESYTIATNADVKGSFTAPFNGSHGWYWKNKTAKPVSIQLLVKGEYEVIGLKQ